MHVVLVNVLDGMFQGVVSLLIEINSNLSEFCMQKGKC